ncbi:extracellular solute-binding protein [Candidatus Kaiserbacteria bacterium]|nr:extracellular solute-binding protein [Candidatus Kaiserbacteria bacterium]
MRSTSLFQIIMTTAFVGFIVLGIGVFSMFGGAFGGKQIGPVLIWGTQSSQTMSQLLQALRTTDSATFREVMYVEKEPATYKDELINAIASGVGPDLFLTSEAQVSQFSDKLILIPYNSVSQSEFVSSYIEEGQLFLTPQGSLALPFSVDPLVMYWNRDLFGSAGIAQPPAYWKDFQELAPKITALDRSNNVTRSAVALGQWQNITNAKAILSALFLQVGDTITARAADGKLVSVFGQKTAAQTGNVSESVLRFYTEFSNPGKTTYSWNRSLPRSNDAFAAGQLAVYFGFASEYKTLAARNPNLRIGVSLLPQFQLQGAGAQMTYGAMTGVSIARGTHNPQGALTVAQKLTSQAAISAWVGISATPPVRRDVSVDTSSSASGAVFIQSALIARGWLDPNPTGSSDVFKTMVESVLSGSRQPGQAIFEASSDFQQLFPQGF